MAAWVEDHRLVAVDDEVLVGLNGETAAEVLQENVAVTIPVVEHQGGGGLLTHAVGTL